MPGPCSAPNGKVSIVEMNRAKGDTVHSGKTALKRGEITHVRKGGKSVLPSEGYKKSQAAKKRSIKMSRTRREEQEQD